MEKEKQVIQESENLEKQTKPIKYLLILDFEATCDQADADNTTHVRFGPPEIIEFPTILYNIDARKVEGEFHTYVKPQINPILTKFCTELTGIQQSWVDQAPVLLDVLKNHDIWLHENGLLLNGQPTEKTFAYVTCGDWDLKQMLPSQCERLKYKRLHYFWQWINIKFIFQRVTNISGKAMAQMLQVLKLPLEGKHHSGIDDCRNITKIAQTLIERGGVFTITTTNSEKGEAPIIVPIPKLDNNELQLLIDKLIKKLDTIDLHSILKSEGGSKKIIGILTKKIWTEFQEEHEVAKNLSAADRKQLTQILTQEINNRVIKIESGTQ